MFQLKSNIGSFDAFVGGKKIVVNSEISQEDLAIMASNEKLKEFVEEIAEVDSEEISEQPIDTKEVVKTPGKKRGTKK